MNRYDSLPIAIVACNQDDLVITYVNNATVDLLTKESWILPSEVDINKLVGHNIDIFHKNSKYIRNILADSSNLPFSSTVKIGYKFLDLKINIADFNNKKRQLVLCWSVSSQENDLSNSVDAMQRSILPSENKIKDIKEKFNIEIAAHYEACGKMGGDFWGVKTISDTELAVYIVDFSGHDMISAVNTLRLDSMMQDKELYTLSPGMLLSRLSNQLFNIVERGQFATMFYARINIKDNSVTYSSAGSMPSILKKETGDISIIKTKGLPLGIIEDAQYDTNQIEFLPKDTLILFSDALVETANKDRKFLDEEELLGSLNIGKYGAHKCLNSLLKKFYSHMHASLEDDLTIACIYRQ